VRRLLALLLVLSPALGAGSLVAAPPAGAQAPVGQDPRGIDLRGLARGAACPGGFELAYRDRIAGRAQVLCTHGPDPAPEGVSVLQQRAPVTAAEVAGAGVAASPAPVPCYGTGSDGFRVQLLYARSAGSPDRYGTFAASFPTWAARVDEVINLSAAETGGTRHVRFLTDASCNPIVSRVTLTSSGAGNFNTMVSELRNQGFNRSDRKYLVWADANVYCGIAQVYYDDNGNPIAGVNSSNGNSRIPGEIARVDNGCWGLSNSVEAHELMHNLGGVQSSAPNSTPGSHCTDDADRMCYADGSVPASAIRQLCAPSHEALFDCNHDDYYSTDPPAGSYLATHWNSANSAFLTSAAPIGGSTTTTTAPPTTTTTVPPTTTTLPPTTTTTTTLPPTTTTTAQPPATTTTVAPVTTTTAPPVGPVPSAPQTLIASQPASGPGVVLTWMAPATGPVTGYRIYRGVSPFVLDQVARVGTGLTFLDTGTVPGAVYYYLVRAVNGAGEGPASNYGRMVAR
jgi:hypothetical protein